MESAVRRSVLAAMCDLLKAAHRGSIGELEAFRQLRELEFQLSPAEASARRSKIKRAVDEIAQDLPVVDEAAEERSEKHAQRLRDYRVRVANARQFVADINRLGATLKKEEDEKCQA